MRFASDHGAEPANAPLALDLSGAGRRGRTRLATLIGAARSWTPLRSYVIAALVGGLVLILALGFARRDDAPAALGPNAIEDNVVRLHAREIAPSCWDGLDNPGPARLTVALEIGIDGKVRYATASGETVKMRRCVEAHVRTWALLPQRQAQTMALPFEVDRR